MSILTHLHQNPELLPPKLDFLYTHRQPFTPFEQESASLNLITSTESVLFLERLRSLFSSKPFLQGSYDQNPYRFALFFTPPVDPEAREARSEASEDLREIVKQQGNERGRIRSTGIPMETRRIADDDLLSLVKEMNDRERRGIVAYVCGPPSMTDRAVRTLRSIRGVVGERVLCEKWW